MRQLSLIFIIAVMAIGAVAAVRGTEVMYVGGSVAGIKDHTKGNLDFSSATALKFEAEKGGAAFVVPYSGVRSIEYGEKIGRRLGVGLAVNPLFLFSHKKRHFLTLTFQDASGANQGIVLEIGKSQVAAVLGGLKANCTVKVEFESKEAEKDASKDMAKQ